MSEETQDYVTVVFGEEKFAPLPYHVFTVGPFTMTTRVRYDRGETVPEAMQRAYLYLEQFARQQFQAKRNNFLINCKGGEQP